MRIRTKLFLLLTLFLLSCNEEPRERQYDEGTLPSNPVNLADMNSEYDVIIQPVHRDGVLLQTTYPGVSFAIVYQLF